MSKSKPKIGLINLGCPKNLVDSEKMLGILSERGFEIILDEERADFIIVNTCSFIKDAEKESVKTIIPLCERGKKIIITGCLVQKYKKELQEAIPEAVAFLGTGDTEKIADIVDSLTSSEESVFSVSEDPFYKEKENIKRFHITAGASAYIKIAEGCDYSCSFCVIPGLRGKYRSRPIESILKEAQELAKAGLSEIILIAQDTTNYGKDIYGKPSLLLLLEKLNNIQEISWIRVMYIYPSLVNDDLIEAISGLEKVVKYIDIPLQHSHPEILRAMKRPIIDYEGLIQKLRGKIKNIALRTVFITGFPGENEEHFNHLMNFVENMEFDRVGVFEYSKEKITDSYKLKGHVPSKIKKFRKKELMQLQQKISKKINESFVNKKVPSLVESINSKGEIIGRTYRDAPEIDGLIYIKTNQIIHPGEIVRVKVTFASEYDLYGVY